MGVHGKIAIEVVKTILCDRDKLKELLKNNEKLKEYWDEIAKNKSGYDKNTVNKICPKETFLSLCETGAVLGIPPGIYCKSKENKKYALTALMILRKNCKKHYSQKELWEEVLKEFNSSLEHNQQMDVVLSLWKEGLLR